MKHSELIGLEVYSIYEGEKLGVVLKCVISKKQRIDKIIIFNDYDDNNYFIDKSSIISMTNELILVKNQECMLPIEDDEYISEGYVGKKLISLDGEILGDVIDCLFNDKLMVEKIIAQKGDVTTDKVVINGSKAIIYSNVKKQKISKYAPKQRIQIVSPLVKVLTMEEPQIIQKEIEHKKLPIKVISLSKNDYVGRVAVNSIIGKNNEFVIKRGEVITNQTIEKAKLHGVSLALAVY